MIRVSEKLRAEGAREQGFSPHGWTNGAASTLPFSHSRLLSLRLICRSTLVSPRLMRTKCHRVSPPRATATELQGKRAAQRHCGLWEPFGGRTLTWSAPTGRWRTCERWWHWSPRWGLGCGSSSVRDGGGGDTRSEVSCICETRAAVWPNTGGILRRGPSSMEM